MSMTDPVADMLTRIRNAIIARHKQVIVPSSSIKKALADILKDEGFIEGYELTEGQLVSKTGKTLGDSLRIELRWQNLNPAITGLKRVSRPGRRVYLGHGDLKKVRHGQGISVLTTSKGVVSDRQARKLKVGGELLCEVW